LHRKICFTPHVTLARLEQKCQIRAGDASDPTIVGPPTSVKHVAGPANSV